jgi:Na+-driven multidrug efflux pump
MSTNTYTQSRPSTSARPRLRLSPRLRRATLVTHIVSAGAWIGIDVLVAVLVLTGWFADDPDVRGVAYQALALFVVWPMFTAAVVCLLSGLLLGLGTKWGLVRYWWVAVKLVINVVLCTLVLVALRPGLDEVRVYGEVLSDTGRAVGDVTDLFFPPVVSLLTLTAATVLAVYKPWGRIRR